MGWSRSLLVREDKHAWGQSFGAAERHLESFGDGACHVLEGPLPGVTVVPRVKVTSLFAVGDGPWSSRSPLLTGSKALSASQLSFFKRSASLQDIACVAPH